MSALAIRFWQAFSEQVMLDNSCLPAADLMHDVARDLGFLKAFHASTRQFLLHANVRVCAMLCILCVVITAQDGCCPWGCGCL